MRGKHAGLICRKVVLETHQSVLHKCSPLSAPPVSPEQEPHCPHPAVCCIRREGPWDPLRACLRNPVSRGKSALTIGHGWMVFAVLEMAVAEPRRLDNADLGCSSDPATGSDGVGGPASCLFPSSAQSILVHIFYCS